MYMDTVLQSVLVRMYALQFAQICKDVLVKLNEELSGPSAHAQMRYINVLAPKINEAYAEYHANWNENFTTAMGKLARREAEALEKEAEELLTEAGVSDERRMFLCELATNYANLPSPLPNKAEHVGNQMLQIYSSGFIARLKKEAVDLKMSKDIIKLLSDIERMGKHIAHKASK